MSILEELAGGKIILLVQGMGSAGKYHAFICRDFGTYIGAGVTPGKGGGFFEDIPIFNTVREAVEQTGVSATVIFVRAVQGRGLNLEIFSKTISKPMPAMPIKPVLTAAAEAVVEAIWNEMPLIVCITDGIPQQDMRWVKAYLREVNSYLRLQNRQIFLIGPNTAGIVFPWERVKIGIMPNNVLIQNNVIKTGNVAVISRSGSLTYEIIKEISINKLGLSACIGIGGDPNRGLDFVDCLKFFERDNRTKAVVLVGEIGDTIEQEAAEFIKKQDYTKPVIAYVVGKTAPEGKTMGHAGAINKGKGGSVQEKIVALEKAGVSVANSINEIPRLIKCKLQ